MKTIFPKADETLLLDILANSDNNVQSASEKLISMGYVKKDFVPPKVSNRQKEEQQKKLSDEKVIPLRPKEYTAEEKEQSKYNLFFSTKKNNSFCLKKNISEAKINREI